MIPGREEIIVELKDVINKRQSVRHFSDQEVDKDTIAEIVKLASRAPSWVDSQPWRVYCAQGEALAKIKKAYEDRQAQGIHSNPDIKVMSRTDWDVRSQENMRLWRHDIVHHFDTYEEADSTINDAGDKLYYSSTILYITVPTQTPEWSIFDSGLFAENVMLLAADKGIATIPTYHSVQHPDVLHKVLQVPDDEKFIIGISLGYPEAGEKINDYRSRRQPDENVLYFR